MTRDVSWSELDTYRQCPHKHSLGWRKRWEPRKLSPALAKGDTFHKIIEVHYKALQSGAGLNDAWNIIAPMLHDKEGNQSEIQELVAWMYAGYLDCYGVDQPWRIIAVEHEAQIWLPTPRGTRSRFRFNMKIDLIVQMGKRLWLVDHKTGKDLPKEKELALADQFGLYVWGLRQLGKPVHGVIYNGIRTQRNIKPMGNEERFSRTLLYRTDQELNAIAVEAYRDFRMAYGMHEDDAPRHPNPDTCKWRCPFTEPCLASRKERNPNLEAHMLKDMGFIQDFSNDRGSRMLPYEVNG